MKVREPKSSAGFTLLEIMVALFLLGLILSAVYSSWLAIVKGSRTGLKAAAEVQRSRIAMRTIEDALSSVRLFTANADYYSFEAENGSKAELSFVSRLPDSFPRSGKFGDFCVRRVTFSLQNSSDSGKELVLRQNPLLMDLDIDEKEHPIVLSKDVKKFDIEFWDTRNSEWVDEWTTTNQLPPMVMITLQFGGDEFQERTRETVSRIIALPTTAVAGTFQAPGRPGSPLGTPPNVIRPGQTIPNAGGIP